MNLSESGILTLVGMALLALVAVVLVWRNRGKLWVKFRGHEAGLDMGQGRNQTTPTKPAGSAGVGHISDVKVGEGGKVDGNINIGHTVQGSQKD